MSETHMEISARDLGKRAVANFAFSISWTRLSWSLEQARFDPESIINGSLFQAKCL